MPDWIIGIDGKKYPGRVQNIPSRDRKIRGLRSEGMSVRAIAAEIGCSIGTVHRVVTTEVRNG